MSRPLLNRRLEGLGTTIFAEMSARALVTGSVNLGQGFPDRDGPAKIAQVAADAILAGRGNQYPPGPGVPELRQAIAAHDERFYGLRYDPDGEILVTAGATEAIAAAMLALVEPGDEVIAFEPYYDSYAANIAMAGGVRVPVTLRPPHFRPDLAELTKAITPRTRLILLNSPHNPTGATIGDGEMESLHDFTAERGIQLVSDEVYHPIYHGRQTKSAARLPHATVIADLSKAFSIAGVRTGWMIEHDAQRRQQYWTARAYFSICNTTTGEILSEIAIRKRDVVLGKTQEAATRNLKLLERFMADHRDVLGWIPPQGGMTAFPWLVSGENDRPFCQAATERGILLAPGDCFDVPSHFRLGFAAAGDNFSKALDRFGAFVKSWSAKMVTA